MLGLLARFIDRNGQAVRAKIVFLLNWWLRDVRCLRFAHVLLPWLHLPISLILPLVELIILPTLWYLVFGCALLRLTQLVQHCVDLYLRAVVGVAVNDLVAALDRI